MGLFDIFKNGKNTYSEDRINSIIRQNQQEILNIFKETQEYFGLKGNKKVYAEEYLQYVSLILSGAMISNKINSLGFQDKSEEQKIIFRSVYFQCLAFVKKHVNSRHIEFPYCYELEENFLLLTIKVNLDKYSDDLNHFLNNGDGCYIEKHEDEDFGTYVNRIQYIFIRETHQVKFIENFNGISLVFNLDDYLNEYNTDERIQKTLELIKKLWTKFVEI